MKTPPSSDDSAKARWAALVSRARDDTPGQVDLSRLLATLHHAQTAAASRSLWATDFALLFGRPRFVAVCLLALCGAGGVASWQLDEVTTLLAWAELVSPLAGGGL